VGLAGLHLALEQFRELGHRLLGRDDAGAQLVELPIRLRQLTAHARIEPTQMAEELPVVDRLADRVRAGLQPLQPGAVLAQHGLHAGAVVGEALALAPGHGERLDGAVGAAPGPVAQCRPRRGDLARGRIGDRAHAPAPSAISRSTASRLVP